MYSRGALPQAFEKRSRGRKRPRRLPPREETTLVCLIKSLIEKRIVVELRNDILLRGRLDDVDDFLNMSMSEATFQTLDGRKTDYDSIYVKGRNVRFVHLPRSLDPAQAIESYRRTVIRTKLQAAQERARALGSGARAPKGQDALDPLSAGGSSSDAERGERDGEGGERVQEGADLETEEGALEEGQEEGGEEMGAEEEERSRRGRSSEPLGGLRHLDPRELGGGTAEEDAASGWWG